MDLITKMIAGVRRISDQDDNYSQEDFDKEFSEDKVNEEMSKYDGSKFELKVSNKSSNPTPEYATDGSSGFDIRANLDEPFFLGVGEHGVIPTGLFFELPTNFAMDIRPRSGLAAKNGVTVLNSPGTIDNDYRGEIKIILINLGVENFIINNGDRIAQGVMVPYYGKHYFQFIEKDTVSKDTQRSDGGFGSTGIK